jgi:PKD repeat protein
MKSGLGIAAFGLLVIAFGCSTDSPTAPEQQPLPPPGGSASAVWNISVAVEPSELTVGADQPATVSVRVRQADNNQPPPTGTTMVISTSLGEFGESGSGARSIPVATASGFASTLLFAGDVVGTAFVNAQLEGSIGQTQLPIVEVIEPVVASFTEQNSNENLSWQFLNTSTGNPTEFFWRFGDGATSTEKDPMHLYGAPGDYVVSLTASKPGSSDTASKILSVTNEEFEVEADFETFADGLNVLFQDLSTGNPTRWSWNFGDGGRSSAQNPTHRYAAEGTYIVQLTASNSQSSSTISKPVEVSLEDELFITAIDPASGPSGGGTPVTIRGEGFVQPLRVFFGDILADVVSVSGTTIAVVTPPGTVQTEACDDDNDTIEGVRSLPTAVTVTVELSSGTSESVNGGFTYIPSGACVGD